MKLTSWDVLPIVHKFRDEVDESKFFIRGETPDNELNALGKRLLPHLGWEESDRLYALIDVTIDPDSVKEKKINRAIALSAGGVYVATLPEARKKWAWDVEDVADDIFITWDDLGNGYSAEEMSDNKGWPVLIENKFDKIPNFVASFLIRPNGELLGKFYPSFSLIGESDGSWEWPTGSFFVRGEYLGDFIRGLRSLCEKHKNSTCHDVDVVTDPSVVSNCSNVLKTYLLAHKDFPPMDMTSISDVCVHNVYHVKVSAKYLTRKWMSIKGTSGTEIDNVECCDIWNVPGLGEEGDGVAILPNSEHKESCTTCFGHGERLCTTCNGTGRHECHHCHGEKEEECPTCHGKKIRKCKECYGNGVVRCWRCDGEGYDFDVCPVCSDGTVEKTRWVNCRKCHGTGISDSGGYRRACWDCDGRGQVKEYYKEKCPNCHGAHKIKTNRKCSVCDGSGRVKCRDCKGTGRTECDECNATGRVSCEKCGGEGNVKCEHCAGDPKKRFVCVDCFGTGKLRNAIRVDQKQQNVGVSWCFSDSVEDALLLRDLPDWHREVILNWSSNKTTVENPHIPQDVSSCVNQAWEYIIAESARTKKVRFQSQQVLFERSPYLVSCDYVSYGVVHKAWLDLHLMKVVMIDKKVTAEVSTRDGSDTGDSAKRETECARCSIKILMDFDKGKKLYNAAKHKEAFPLLKAAADCGIAEAMSWTGGAYYNGHADISDGEKSKKIAVEWFKKAALAGSLSGVKNLGNAYYRGSGVTRDNRKAYELFLNAVSRGFSESELLLAYCYDDGKGVDEDKSSANKLYWRLANRGDRYALYYLGLNYLNGSGVAKNEQEAFRLISLSAERGDSDAKKKLKEMGPVDLQGQNLESGAVGVDFTGVDLPIELGKPMSVEDILAPSSGQSASDQKQMKGSQGSDKGGKQKRKTSSVQYSYSRKRFLFFVIGLSLGWLGWHFRYAGRKNYFWAYWVAAITLLFAPRHSILWNCCCLAIAWLWIGCTLFMRNDGDKRRMPWFK